MVTTNQTGLVPAWRTDVNRYRINVSPVTYIRVQALRAAPEYIRVQYRMSGLLIALVLTAAALLALCVRG